VFQDAIHAAQDVGADYVVYDVVNGSRRVASVAHLRVEAICTSLGAQLIAAGISASKKSLYDYDAGEFTCGTLAQLS
jgi:hypothetical protein